jgi:hypothetical protein
VVSPKQAAKIAKDEIVGVWSCCLEFRLQAAKDKLKLELLNFGTARLEFRLQAECDFTV